MPLAFQALVRMYSGAVRPYHVLVSTVPYELVIFNANHGYFYVSYFYCAIADQSQETVLCDIVSSTNIGYRFDEWNCMDQKPSSEYCNHSFIYERNHSAPSWRGLTCSASGSITHIDLNGLQLNGTLPESIGALRHLIFLDVSNNILQGSIATSFGQLSQLTYLSLANNSFTGDLPYGLCYDPIQVLLSQGNIGLLCYPSCFSFISLNTDNNSYNHNHSIPLLNYNYSFISDVMMCSNSTSNDDSSGSGVITDLTASYVLLSILVGFVLFLSAFKCFWKMKITPDTPMLKMGILVVFTAFFIAFAICVALLGESAVVPYTDPPK